MGHKAEVRKTCRKERSMQVIFRLTIPYLNKKIKIKETADKHIGVLLCQSSINMAITY